MSSRSRAAIEIWRGRTTRTLGDRAFLVYAVFMVGLVAIFPVARAVWLSAASAAGAAVFASPSAPGVTALVAAALWSGALLLGRDRGPLLLPPFLTFAFATSDLPRSETFRGPLLRAGALVTALSMLAAGLIGGSLMSQGLVNLLSTATFVAVGALVGVITTVAWLGGQAFPVAAIPSALGLLALGAITAIAHTLQPFTPWGWVGLAYPGNGSPLAAIPLIAAAAVLTAVVPTLMNRLRLAELSSQAARWESAMSHSMVMDFGAAATIYQGRPHVGRGISAIRSTSRLPLTFLIRDAIGAARTPGRLIVAMTALAAAGVLMFLAFAPATPSWLLGAAAGVLIFAGLGPLTDGMRHAASVASDLPLYGISDERLFANHSLFPSTVVAIVLVAVIIACSVLVGIGAAAPIINALALGLITLLARASNALKGSLPISLLTPAPSPMGDLSVVTRMAWALDGVLLAALAGAFAPVAFEAPILPIGIAVVIVGVGIKRWRDRS